MTRISFSYSCDFLFSKVQKYILLCIFVLTSCNIDPLSSAKDAYGSDELVRLTLSGSEGTSEPSTRAVWSDVNGTGNLTFNWERVNPESEETGYLSLVMSDGNHLIPTWTSDTSVSEDDQIYHSGMSVSPDEDDPHHAEFQTTRFYKKTDLKNARYCMAVSGESQITADTENGLITAHLEMPSTFIQTADQDPGFLRKHMFMYSSQIYKETGTSLDFRHLTSTLRLIVTNAGNSPLYLESVSYYVSGNMASSSADLEFDSSTGNTSVTFSGTGYEKITTVIEGGITLTGAGSKYTAYSMVLPLGNADSLRGKIINFCISSGDSEYHVLQIDAEKLAAANGNEIYDWVGGKSYTVRITIGEGALANGEVLSENNIEISSTSAGSYVLEYIGADGQPLPDYAPICILTVDQIARYEDFINVNIAPRNAENIGIYDSSGNLSGYIPLSTLKKDHTQPLYSFGLLSDVHCQENDAAESVMDLQRALTFFNKNNVTLTCVCGDLTQDATAGELDLYKQTVDAYSPTVPVLTTTGNHDCARWGQINESLWEEYIGLPLVFEHTVTLPDNTADHFLFLGMSYWEDFTAPYLDSHLAWLESKLEEYRNERCFIITHLFFPDRAGNMNYIYPSTNWISGVQLERLSAMCDNYVNTIWFSGHSHWKWDMQKYQGRANVFRTYDYTGRPTSGWCVHVPSCAYPADSDGISTRNGIVSESEGAIVEVYADHIDILGLDLKYTRYLPIATYRLETTLTPVRSGQSAYPL